MHSEETISLVKVDQNRIIDFIGSAENRLLIAKPSLFPEEVAAIRAVLKKHNCNCQVFLEEGDNAVRLGFGKIEALKDFLSLTDRIKVVMADSIRLSMVLVDNKALFFIPPALAWEEGISSDRLVHPNGVWLSGAWVDQIFAIYAENKKPDADLKNLPKNVIPFPLGIMTSSAEAHSIEKIEKTIRDLEENKPVDPTRLRKIQFYRNHFKIVRIEVEGANLRTKSVSLRIFNKFFHDREERLKSSWQVFTPKEISEFSSLTDIYTQIENAKMQHKVVPVGRFGNLISLREKAAFEAKIRQLENSLKTRGEGDSISDLHFKLKLGDSLKKSRKNLIEYLLSQFSANKGAIDMLHQSEPLLKRISEPSNSPEEILSSQLGAFIDEKLKFPSYETIMEAVNIKLDYYDVSDELLNENKDFRGLLEKGANLPKELRSYDEGYFQEE